MAQATNASTPRRRAVQSAKCAKSPADAKPLLNGALCALGRSGHGITEVAESLADLQKLVTMLANAEGPADRARKELAANNMVGAEEYAALCRTESHLEGRTMIDKIIALLEGLRVEDLDAARPVDLERFAGLARHWASLADLSREARGDRPG